MKADLRLVENKEEEKAVAIKIPIQEILVVHEDNVRSDYVSDEIDSLADSLKIKGQLQSILVERLPDVREDGKKYKLVAGYRRYLAAEKAEIPFLFAIVKEFETPEHVIAANISENKERVDIFLYDCVRQVYKLAKAGWDLEKIARETGFSEEMTESIYELCTEVAPPLLKLLKHNEDEDMLHRLRYCARKIDGFNKDQKFQKQIEWWKSEGWKQKEKPIGESRRRRRRAFSPDHILGVAERIRMTKQLPGENGPIRPSQEVIDAVVAILGWCANPQSNKNPYE